MLKALRNRLLTGASYLGLANGMAAAEAAAFKKNADAWIANHPREAKDMARRVELAKQRLGHVRTNDALFQ